MKFSERSLNNLKGVHPLLAGVMHEAVRNTPLDFTITEGVRTQERQMELYAQGRTKPGAIVTQVDGVVKKSNHQVKSDGYGYAVDLYPHTGKGGSINVNDAQGLSKVAAHILSVAGASGVNVEWGGNWKMKDYPHFELKK